MPGLPAFETLARGLRQSVHGRRILSVLLGRTDFMTILPRWFSSSASGLSARYAMRPNRRGSV
jgi:formamidopyrimidine-DNA glycosylase